MRTRIDRGTGRAAGFRFALVVSKYNDFVTDRLQAGRAGGARRRRGVTPTTSRSCACRARSRFRWPRSTRPRAGRFDADRLPRLPDSRRDAALRVHRVGGRARSDDGGGRHRRADGLRRADHQFGGRSVGARRRRPGNKGYEAAVAAIEMAEVVAQLTRAQAGRRGREERRKIPRHRAREAALQILYQWEVGRRDVRSRRPTRSSTFQWPNAEAPSDELRAFATTLARDTVERLDAIDPLIAETAERWRPERMAVLDRLILRMAVCELMRDRGDAARGGDQRGARAGADLQRPKNR